MLLVTCLEKAIKLVINFKNNDNVTCGARPTHLRNEEIVSF